MADVGLEFKHELNYGDVVTIHVQAADFDKLGFDIYYLLEIEHPEKNIVAGKAKTGMLCFDYTNKRKLWCHKLPLINSVFKLTIDTEKATHCVAFSVSICIITTICIYRIKHHILCI
jgi:hypothetical protein